MSTKPLNPNSFLIAFVLALVTSVALGFAGYWYHQAQIPRLVQSSSVWPLDCDKFSIKGNAATLIQYQTPGTLVVAPDQITCEPYIHKTEVLTPSGSGVITNSYYLTTLPETPVWTRLSKEQDEN